MRDRYVFSADRKATEYRDVLEITPGHARLVTPMGVARSMRWLGSIVLMMFYLGYAGIVLAVLLGGLVAVGLPQWLAVTAIAAAWIAGFLVMFRWWDRQTLPLLADSPLRVEELVLLGARSFGTYQDVRARTVRGEELHLVVDTRAPRFWEAVQLLQAASAVSG